MLKEINETTDFLRKRTNFKPEYAIVLGSGLGGLADKVKKEFEIPYNEILNFPVSTVKGHGSKLILGELNGRKIAALQGRFHFYEGYSMQELSFPIRVLKLFGAEKLIVSNACGGVNPQYKIGDLMIIEDHINLMGSNPLIGFNNDKLGPRFPDMSLPYDKTLIQKAKQIANQKQFRCHIGVYAAVTGPCFETRAEYKYIRIIGADAVGMSTVPEVIVARHMGMPCFGISIITDIGGGDQLEAITHEDVLKVARTAEEKVTALVTELIS
ncbi:MAG: purine-nucleoside phosphorylase [Bacteroidia bacterium]|nr:purine-nucleoside phosphorylase [Bacteroidia bacterium]MCZ2277127.1 purine-nucleoside phosphorylase [Bacteroidia bacterium]